MRERFPAVLAVLCVVVAVAASAGGSTPTVGARLAPLPAAQAPWSHAPFLSGACTPCHARANARDPGPVARTGDGLCFDCHDEVGGRGRSSTGGAHHARSEGCTGCHNPHNGRTRALLR